MPFISRRARLNLTDEDTIWLERLAQSRTESAARVQRAQMVLRYAQGQTVSAIAAAFKTNRPKVERCVSKALELGVRAAMRDLPGRGRRRSIMEEDKTWIVDLACQKPKDLGYAQELWTTRLLAKHIRKHCVEGGHPQLRTLRFQGPGVGCPCRHARSPRTRSAAALGRRWVCPYLDLRSVHHRRTAIQRHWYLRDFIVLYAQNGWSIVRSGACHRCFHNGQKIRRPSGSRLVNIDRYSECFNAFLPRSDRQRTRENKVAAW
jgi:transposase